MQAPLEVYDHDTAELSPGPPDSSAVLSRCSVNVHACLNIETFSFNPFADLPTAMLDVSSVLAVFCHPDFLTIMTNTLSSTLNRRKLLGSFGSLLALSATGCATTVPMSAPITAPALVPPPSPPLATEGASLAPIDGDDSLMMYAAMPQERFPVPAVDLQRLDPRYIRQTVDYVTEEAPGTVIVDTATRYLYHVGPAGTATRYGAGIGAGGFAWSGRAHIAYKREWPVWTPPDAMIQRQPRLEKWRKGQPPGIKNPLGARALYIHQGNRDTLYRIHGTGEAHTIGKAISSGCVRLLHQDVIHLYERVRSGSPILVLASNGVTQPPAST